MKNGDPLYGNIQCNDYHANDAEVRQTFFYGGRRQEQPQSEDWMDRNDIRNRIDRLTPVDSVRSSSDDPYADDTGYRPAGYEGETT